MVLSGKRIFILKGDRRQEYLASFLKKEGCLVSYEGCLCAGETEQACQMGEIIFGRIPFLTAGPVDLSVFPKMKCLFGGIIPKEIMEYCDKKHIFCFDFMKDEILTDYNAIATAEGVIAEAIMAFPSNLGNSSCLVLGYGHCGKVLSSTLRDLGAHVTVCVRRRELLEELSQKGFLPLPLNRCASFLWQADCIFNTIPAQVLDESLLRMISPESLVLDIASSPGGIDKEAALRLGIHFKTCLGLPGKYAPKASAKAILSRIQTL